MNIKPRDTIENRSYKPFSKAAVNQTTITFFNKQTVSDLTNSINELGGGINQECKTFLENIGQHHVEQIHPQLDGEDMGEYGYVKQNIDVEKYKNPYIINPNKYNTQQELFDAIKHWWVFKYRKNERTINDRLRYAKKMAEHEIFPINWFDLNQNQIIAYLEHKEYVEYQQLPF